VLLAAVWLLLDPEAGGGDPQAAVQTSLPGLEPATAEPTLPGLATLAPDPGTVVQAAGPFDDRFRFERLRFGDGQVSGAVAVTSDVSELLELEVLAGFYDRDGSLVGTGRYVHHLDEATTDPGHEGAPAETHPFTVAVPDELADRAVAAAVGVPVLVNE